MTIIQDPIKSAIWRFLNHYAYSDALFLAERLYAEVGSDEALFLLATSYYRLGKPKIVQVFLEKHGYHQPQCKLLYARACWELEDYSKAEQALVGCSVKFRCIFTVINNLQKEHGESACFALALLGRIYRQTERSEWAEKCFTKSLNLNPFLWSSFEKMCEAGSKPSPEDLFSTASLINQVDYKPIHTVGSNSSSAAQTPHPVQSQTRKKKGSSVKVLAPRQVGSNVENVEINTNSSSQNSETQIASNRTPRSGVTMIVGSFHNSEDSKASCERKTPSHNDKDFLRSTPSETSQWDSSIGSYTGPLPSEKRFTKTQIRITQGATGMSPLIPSFGVMPLYETPSPVWERSTSTTTPSDMAPPLDINPPVKKMVTRLSRKAGDASTATTGKLFFSSENNRRDGATPPLTSMEPSNPSPATRRSTRFANSGNSVKENAKKTTKSKPAQPKDVTNKKHSRARTKQAPTDNMPVRNLSDEISKADCPSDKVKTTPNVPAYLLSTQKSVAENLVKHLQNLGSALLSLCQFNCKKAVEYLEHLPPRQRDTGWCLSLLARSYFEMTDYKKAAKIFEELRNNHSHHVPGLALYSTALWHLQDGVALSTLAHDLIKLDFLSPETWCAVGNCFSLRRDYDSAIKFFGRAAQVAPSYAYAHTLLGHEYSYSEDNERAMACYRKAIHCDSRHYNAWYGIGSIYYKQENFALAEIHFRRALSINQHSSVLLCHLGIVQHAQKRSALALTTLSNALELDPRSPLCKFHRASILFATDRHNEALAELLQLKQIVPKESLVYFLIGKTYKILGENHLAMMNFSWALDLDPKGVNNHIKDAIDKQQAGDDPSNFDEQIGQLDETSFNSGAELMDSTSQEYYSTETEEVMHDSDESL